MSNLLVTPSLWTAYDDTSPPSYWNGTAYLCDYEGLPQSGAFFSLSLNGDAGSGNTFAGVLSLINGTNNPPFSNACYINTVADGQLLSSQGPATLSAALTFSFAATTGSSIILAHAADDVEPGQNYDGTTLIVPTANPNTDCMELGRVTKSYVSGYTASRRETRRIRRFSKRCLVADFNGSIPKGPKIVFVRWNCTSPWSLLMSNARIQSDQRSVAVDAAFNFAGFTAIMATVTFDNGELYSQEFFFETLDQPIYPQAQYLNASGPYVLEYTWPTV